MESDHQPVRMTLAATTSTIKLAPKFRMNWGQFNEELQHNTPTRPIHTGQDVNQLATDLMTAISTAANNAKISIDSSRPPPLPTELREKIWKKRDLRKDWQHTRCPTTKSLINQLGEEIRLELHDLNQESWCRRIDAASEDWSSLHKLCRQMTNKPPAIRPLLHNDGKLRYRAEDRAEIFADHLEKQFQPNPSLDAEHTKKIEDEVSKYLEEEDEDDVDSLISFSPGQIIRTIRNAKPNKAPGSDGVTNMMLRYIPQRTAAAITRLFNGVIRTGTFPASWKRGEVIMIPKPGKNTQKAEGYRPITLLPTVSKIFERLLLQHIVPHIPPREEQYGFRSEHSTTLQLTRVIHLLTAAKNKKEKAAIVMLDMEKAFDRVWHDGLIFKLSTSPVPRRVVKVIASFLRGRTCHARVEQSCSTDRPIAAGVPQGSCLSPVLYCRYTDDIPTDNSTHLALYADDAAYIATSLNATHAAKKLQRILDLLPDWLAKWRLAVNVTKTQAIKMEHGLCRPVPKLHLFEQEIPWTPTAKYLGVTIDSRLCMIPHTKNVVSSVRATMSLLKPLMDSQLPVKTKISLFKTYVRSKLTYAAPSWYSLLSETNRKKMRAQQHKALRQIVKAPRYVRNSTIQRDLKMEPIEDFIKRLATSMFDRAAKSRWTHLQETAPYHRRPPDAKRFPRDLIALDEEDQDNGAQIG